MKRTHFKIAVIGCLLLSILAGCKKTFDAGSAPASASSAVADKGGTARLTGKEGDDEKLEAGIKEFYSHMKDIHDGGKPSDVPVALADAEFYIEAAYNYMLVRSDYERESSFGTFNFTIPVSSEGTLTETQVSDCMYRIKSYLMEANEAIDYNEKQLSLFDLQVTNNEEAGEATFAVNYSITKSAPVIDPSTANAAIAGDANKAWAVLRTPCGNSTPVYYNFPAALGLSSAQNSYYKGISKLDYSTTNVIYGTQDCTKPGAAVILRSYGMSNYYNTYTSPNRPLQMAVNIQLAWADWPGAVSVSSDYVSRGYNSYDAVDQYHTYIYSGSTWPAIFYSQWLNTAMMNYYLGYIPAKINSHIPAGKILADFQILYMTPVGNGHDVKHAYQTYYGTPTRIVIQSDTPPLATF